MSVIANQSVFEKSLEAFRNYLKNQSEAERKEIEDDNLKWLSFFEGSPLNNLRL